MSSNHWVTSPGGKDRWTLADHGFTAPVGSTSLRWELADASARVLQSGLRPYRPGQGDTWDVDLGGLPPGEYLSRVKLLVGDAVAAGWEHSLAVAGPDDIFLLFEKEPVARGMTFDTAGGSPEQMVDGDCARWAWTPGPGNPPGKGPRVLHLHLTDDRFRHGAMPVVDVSMGFRQLVKEPVKLELDTQKGYAVAAYGKGPAGPDYPKNPPFQVATGKMNDARLAPPDGRGDDLRCSVYAAPGSIRSVFIHGYDLATQPDWRRLLVADGFGSERPRLLWAPGRPRRSPCGCPI